ncbi:hypothetical protein M0802_006457 [Mischocyttarus mexicanus]|nr:hypothetical protein M0802_006457 [Mischocyttarus mexicanus]
MSTTLTLSLFLKLGTQQSTPLPSTTTSTTTSTTATTTTPSPPPPSSFFANLRIDCRSKRHTHQRCMIVHETRP